MQFEAYNGYWKSLGRVDNGQGVQRPAASPLRLPFASFLHLNAMTVSSQFERVRPSFLRVRKPPEPSPPPIKEPPDSPENPDSPIREPDPDEPAQM